MYAQVIQQFNLSFNTGGQGRTNNSTGEFGHNNQSVAQVEALSAITQLRHNDEHIYHRDTTVYVFTDVVPAASEEEPE